MEVCPLAPLLVKVTHRDYRGPVITERTSRVNGPDGLLDVVVRRSTRRRRTVAGRLDRGRLILQVPARLTRREEDEWVDRMAARLARRSAGPTGDAELAARAAELAARFLDPVVGHEVRPRSIRYVDNQQQRWGSTTPTTGDIRLSSRLRDLPDWVIDHVIIHELAHLVEANHTARFHALVAANPRAERAEGFLEGWAARSQASL